MSVDKIPMIAQYTAVPYIPFFEPGPRLIDGGDLNTLFSILFFIAGVNQGLTVTKSAAQPIGIVSQNIVIVMLPAPAPITFNLPSVLTRVSAPLRVYDWNGNAGDMTFNPSGAEKIGGVNGPWKVGSGGVPGTGGYLELMPVYDPADGVIGWLPSV